MTLAADRNALVADSLYRVAITYRTGRLITESKFTANGTNELRDKPNRRVDFPGGDTTVYRARSDQVPYGLVRYRWPSRAHPSAARTARCHPAYAARASVAPAPGVTTDTRCA